MKRKKARYYSIKYKGKKGSGKGVIRTYVKGKLGLGAESKAQGFSNPRRISSASAMRRARKSPYQAMKAGKASIVFERFTRKKRR